MKPRSLTGAILSLVLSAIAFQALIGADAASSYRPSYSGYPCPSAGKFIDPGSCNYFYSCEEYEGRLFSRVVRCLEGDAFDDQYKVCVSAISLTSPPRCMPQPPRNPAQPALDPTQDGVRIEEVSVNEAVDTEMDVVDPTEEIVVVDDPTEEIVVVDDPTEEIVAVDDPTEEIVVVDPTEEIVAVDPTEEIVVVDPTEDILPELRVCDHISNIDMYATTVISSPELMRSVAYAQKYNSIHTKYNKAVAHAQNFTQLWRHGESILDGMKMTYRKASQYEGEFDRMREINERQVQNLAKGNTNIKSIKTLEKDIRNLEQDIITAEEALQHTTVEAVRQYFLTTIESKRQAIKEKRQAMKSTSLASRELSERVIFLEYIRDNAREVVELATKSQSQVTGVLDSLNNDSAIFNNLASKTNGDISDLMAEENNNIVSKNDQLREQELLERRKISLNSELNTLNDENQRLLRNMSNLIAKMEKKTDIFNEQRRILCKPKNLGMFDLENITISDMDENRRTEYLIQCEYMLRRENVYLDLSEEDAQMAVVKQEIEENRINIQRNLDGLRSFTEQMRIISNALPGLDQRLDEITFELGKLKSLQQDVDNLKEGVSYALLSFSALELELQELMGGFSDLERDLDGKITGSRATEDDKAKQHQIDAIKLLLEQVDLNLSQSVIPDVNCPRTKADI